MWNKKPKNPKKINQNLKTILRNAIKMQAITVNGRVKILDFS
jgi:hypothetical protein